MKIILNKSYGGFSITKRWANILGTATDISDNDDLRFNEGLIEAIEANLPVDGDFARLIIATIPDDATDFTVFYNDGFETLIYVVDGKLHKA